MADSSKSGNQPAAAPVAASTPAPMFTNEQLMAALVQSITKQTEFQEALVKNAPRRRKSMEEYLEANPRKKLLHDVYQNGRPVNPAGLSVATIKKLDTLATGIYCDNLITVHRISDGVSGVNSRIHLLYSNKEVGQRMQFYMRFPTFTAIVNAVLEDMAARGINPVHEASAVDGAATE